MSVLLDPKQTPRASCDLQQHFQEMTEQPDSLIYKYSTQAVQLIIDSKSHKSCKDCIKTTYSYRGTFIH